MQVSGQTSISEVMLMSDHRTTFRTDGGMSDQTAASVS